MNNINKPTCSKLAPANAGASNDTSKKFKATLTFTKSSEATVIIEAASREEAEEKAWKLQTKDITNWGFVDDELHVFDVWPVEGGQDND